MLTSILKILMTRSFKPFIFKYKCVTISDFSNVKNLGLYVHIPFCKKLCKFCPYCKVKYEQSLANNYKDALIKEIELVCSNQKEKIDINSLYFGGGTPALMANDLSEIIKCLKKFFNINGQIGLELHPEDINIETLKIIKEAGITMVSIGIQSFDKNCLSIIGRENIDYERKINLVKTFGFSTINVDLIFAIPGQTDESIKLDIDTAFKNGATQISTYPFIDFTFTDNNYKPLSEKIKKKNLCTIVNHAKYIDKHRCSVWTFASKNTYNYSSITRDNFIGFGVSATTLLIKEFKINTFNIKSYINSVSNNKFPTSLTLDFTKRQRACYYLFWNCYLMKIDPDNFKYILGEDIHKMFAIELLIARFFGIITKQDGIYYLTSKGAYYYHYVEQKFTTSYIDKMWNISNNNSFPDKLILK